MKLQNQCCTLEQGKRLVELGVKVEATFWWMPAKDGLHKEYIQYGNSSGSIAPAYNVAELGELLPSHYYTEKNYYNIDWWPVKDGKEVYQCCLPNEFGTHDGFVNEAQARAALLIYLLENKLTTCPI